MMPALRRRGGLAVRFVLGALCVGLALFVGVANGHAQMVAGHPGWGVLTILAGVTPLVLLGLLLWQVWAVAARFGGGPDLGSAAELLSSLRAQVPEGDQQAAGMLDTADQLLARAGRRGRR
jgi:TM2 domain-containing membrane protein YozV